MDDIRKNQIKNIIYKFAELTKIDDEQLCNNLITKLYTMNINDSIDIILISLNSLLNRKVLSQDDIFPNLDLLLSLNPEKYNSTNDLIKRLNWIKSMNMENSQMPLTENHKLVMETFDKFNNLIGLNFDCFYTGGLMGYLATNHPLERYHSDLDLFINEQQLEMLYELVNQSQDFDFVSNMDHKGVNGHEYKITYKGTPMSIGLFLFERTPNQEIVLKEYYYDDKNKSDKLFVDEHHLSKDYANMMFSNQVIKYNGTLYRMQSLESIYNAKKNSRPKDRYDANIIRDFVDLNVDFKLDTQKQDNYDVKHKSAIGSIIEVMENKMSRLLKNTEFII